MSRRVMQLILLVVVLFLVALIASSCQHSVCTVNDRLLGYC